MDESKLHLEKMLSVDKEPNNDPRKERQEKIAEIFRLVKEINESGECIPFPGIHPEIYSRMKADEEEFPGLTTPIDEIIERCKKDGIKIVLGKHPESGNVFVLPANSGNIEMDSIAPHQLLADNVKNEHLSELIQLTTKKRVN